MQNPLQNEDAAFRLVFWTIAYFAPIVVASWISPWFGFAVFVLASAVVVVLVRRRSGRSTPPPPPGRANVEDTPPDTLGEG
jgi:membrane protein implicated in regulation of membrane protease activity